MRRKVTEPENRQSDEFSECNFWRNPNNIEEEDAITDYVK